MRTVAVHRDAVVITSLMWQTNAVALRAGDEAMLVDSPYYPEELDALEGILAGAGFEPDALIATHADFDHVLGRVAFPGLALGLAESSVERLRREPGATQRELRDKDAELYVERPSPLALGQVQSLPVPGSVELGEHELELHPAEGHTDDGCVLRENGTDRSGKCRREPSHTDEDFRSLAIAPWAVPLQSLPVAIS